ncbi:MAG: 5-formyltetrahydrofolate cyclo-ligase [Candidatus Parabeggiatoa sp. nov. 2]|nr:MAG: 5-formyltetrahydrofolate cyclo-ligase [Beggiatoa sp. 4572_84]RKZ58022.1 MAG: 5-formyltetrahydrofolate cyclo-ligase [Gammaproteobacteria bacterium]
MTKEQLRKQFLETRKNFDLDSLQENSQAISQNFFNYIDLSDIQKLHVFLPILKQNEINTWFIINGIRQNHPHITPIISKSNLKTSEMDSYVFDTNTKIVENRWGIPEPVDAIKCPDDTIDMILMPLLCFDKQGFRVGYGKGFYDRFLQKCRTDIIKIGLSLFEPVDKIEDVNEYDAKMDFCVMSKGVWKLKLIDLSVNK